jgi:hypothetical protein
MAVRLGRRRTKCSVHGWSCSSRGGHRALSLTPGSDTPQRPQCCEPTRVDEGMMLRLRAAEATHWMATRSSHVERRKTIKTLASQVLLRDTSMGRAASLRELASLSASAMNQPPVVFRSGAHRADAYHGAEDRAWGQLAVVWAWGQSLLELTVGSFADQSSARSPVTESMIK